MHLTLSRLFRSLFLIILCWSIGLSVSADTKPNILLIVADDMGWADVGYHNSEIETPHIDQLAKDGVELDQFYVAPMCTPTRAALLTGRYWSRFGNTTPSNSRVLPWKTLTLSRALKEDGYTTHISGKWHLGSKPEWGPRQFGFEQSHGSLAGGVNPINHLYKHGQFSRTWHRNDKLIEEEGHVTDLIEQETVKFIRSKKENPFFIYVPFTAVHTPFDEPEKWLKSASHVQKDRQQYVACAQHMDHAIGQMVEALKSSNQFEDTLIIFFSDNGGTNGDDSSRYPDTVAKGKVKGLNTPLRGWKTEVYEGGIRVPALVHWPRKLKPTKVTTPLHVIDWMPTLCELLSITPLPNTKWDGVNIWPTLEGRNQSCVQDRELYWQGVQRRSAAIRKDHWKLVVHRGKKSRTELYNLASDPNEKLNVASKYLRKVEELQHALTTQESLDNDSLPNDAK